MKKRLKKLLDKLAFKLGYVPAEDYVGRDHHIACLQYLLKKQIFHAITNEAVEEMAKEVKVLRKKNSTLKGQITKLKKRLNDGQG